jgi:hypothetical protein
LNPGEQNAAVVLTVCTGATTLKVHDLSAINLKFGSLVTITFEIARGKNESVTWYICVMCLTP